MSSSSQSRAPAPPAGTARRLVLEEFLPYRLNILSTIVSQGFARLYSARFGISIPEWRVVAMLGQHGTLTSKAVGQRTHMHKTMVSRAVSDLDATAWSGGSPTRPTSARCS